MARLPSEMYLMQQTEGTVRLFEDGSEDLVVAFDPADGIAVQNALAAIRRSHQLGDEDKCLAQLWAGYFHAHANRDPEVPRATFVTEGTEGTEVLVFDGQAVAEVARFDPRDQDAVAKAQFAVYTSGLSEDDKGAAHFWSGFYYGQASS